VRSRPRRGHRTGKVPTKGGDPDRPGRSGEPRFAPRFAPLILLVGALLLPGIATAQGTPVDGGAFLLSRDGEAIGTERFVIRRAGTGAQARILATSELELELSSGPRYLTTALELRGPEFTVRAYQVKVSGDQSTEVYLVRADRRLQARVVSDEGEELREYRAEPDLVVLDEGIAHHYHFVLARLGSGERGEATALVPLASQEGTVQLTRRGTERIPIAGVMISARRFEIEDEEGIREIWADEEGRILRVVNHTTGFRAERRNLPE